LRFNFVVAAHHKVRLTPQFLRALSRLGGRAFYETIVWRTFHEFIRIDGFVEKSICGIALQPRLVG
jgi:hypothetical protein